MPSTSSDSERITREEMYLRIAEVVALRSTCQRLKVGAVITDETLHNILSIGYNGNYSGGPNGCDSSIPGSCGCVHAELNALLKIRERGHHVLFCTDAPCENCAKAIVNAEIRSVFYNRSYRLTTGLEILARARVSTKQITLEDIRQL